MPKLSKQPCITFSQQLIEELEKVYNDDSDGTIWARHITDGIKIGNNHGSRSVEVEIWGAVSVTVRLKLYGRVKEVQTTTSQLIPVVKMIIDHIEEVE